MLDNPFPRLSQRVFNKPLMIHPGKAEVIVAAIGQRFGVANVTISEDAAAMMAGEWGFEDEADEAYVGYDRIEGVGVIPVRDTLVQRLDGLTPYSGMTGYDQIRQNLLMALNDPKVEAICLAIDSPGGEVSGCFDLVDTIYRARDVKPVWAILDESAFSAAYALASAAERIIVPRTGGTGSVGVIYLHLSYEGFLKGQGVVATLVTKGDLKGEGNEFQNLTKETFERLKADVGKVGELFDATVARNRGMAEAAVFDTQAGTFLGRDGVAIGFADEVMAPDEAFLALLDEL